MPHGWRVFQSRVFRYQTLYEIASPLAVLGSGRAMTEDSSTLRNTMENNMKKGFGWYFLFVGIFGIVMAFARAKSEREVFLILAMIPMAFLAVRGAEFLGKRNRE